MAFDRRRFLVGIVRLLAIISEKGEVDVELLKAWVMPDGESQLPIKAKRRWDRQLNFQEISHMSEDKNGHSISAKKKSNEHEFLLQWEDSRSVFII